MAGSLVLFYIVINELSTDNFYPDQERMYQVFVDYTSPDWSSVGTSVIQPFIPAMLRNFPEIEAGTVTYYNGETDFEYNYKTIKADVVYADSQYFKVFNRKIIKKKSNNVLSAVNTAVITEKFARKCFGEGVQPLSKIIKLNGVQPLEVVGVVENWPPNSSQTSDVIISFATLRDENRLYMGWDGGDSFQGYIKLHKNIPAEKVENKIPQFIKKYIDVERDQAEGLTTKYFLVPVSRAELIEDPFLKVILLIMGFVGFLLLGLVSFNLLLINLSTSDKLKHEIAIRRIWGASVSDLQQSVFAEGLFYVVITGLIATVFIWLVNPFIQQFYQFNIFSLLSNPSYLWLLLTVLAIVFIVNVVVPSANIFRFFSFKRSLVKRRKSLFVQRLLLVIQMGISLTLLVFLWFIHAQLVFANNFDKGYNPHNLIYIELNTEPLYKNHIILKNEISKLKNVLNVTLSDGVITQGLSGNGFYDNPQRDKLKIFRQLAVDEDFFAAMQMKVEGSGFKRENDKNYIVVNREAGRIINAKNPVGKYLYRNGKRKIIGVVPDFIVGSVHSKMEPVVFVPYNEPSVYSVLSIRLSGKDISTSVAEIKSVIEKIVPGRIFQIKFYDDDIKINYEFDKTVEKTIAIFALLAMLITIFGLIGFSINQINKRTKEIGIRKVNGATTSSILLMLNRHFMMNIAFTLVVFIPVSYFLVKLWLQNYAYRVEINPWVFIMACILLIITILIVVSSAVYRYANKNPVETLRYE